MMMIVVAAAAAADLWLSIHLLVDDDVDDVNQQHSMPLEMYPYLPFVLS